MSNDNKTNKKKSTVRPMIITPIVFVLIFVILALPLSVKAFGIAKNKVHGMRETLHITYGDIDVSDDYYNECVNDSLEMSHDALEVADKIGTLKCNNAAVECDIYYGINRVSKRYGAGLSTKTGFFGEGSQIHIDGNVADSFKALSNVEIGDTFTVNIPGGEYVYTVREITVAGEYSGKLKGEYLLLTTDVSSDAFSHQDKKRLMIAATLGEEVTD